VEWVETTGKTVAEALDAALDQLGVDEQEAEYEVLEEAQKGLFGRLRSEARIRARVRPVRPRPKVERRDRRRRGSERGQGRGGNGRRGDSTKAAGRGQGSNGARRAEADGGASKPAVEHAAVTTADAEGRGGEGTSRSAARRRRRRGGGGGGGTGGAKRTGADVSTDNGDENAEEGRPVLDLEAQREAVEEFLGGLVTAFGRPEAAVSVTVVEDGVLEADVSGEELGVLVGPKGQTLQSVQELIRSMVQRRFVGEAHARVRVDIAGYRQRRREALERFTRTVAEQVLSTGRAKVLDPMLAGDRKVVHDVANEIEGIVTRSEGEDPGRRVIIQPA